jgi:predicted metal-dependent hydrolase
VEVEVRVSQRARRARIELPPGRGPLLVVPRGTSDRQVQRLLDEWRPWVERRLARRPPAPELAPMTEREGRARAREAIERIAAAETGRLGVSYRRVRIADQRTRWGSCSPGGTLSFSWRLALAPPQVLDYVVVHELCHLREANHGPRFWALVERLRPGYREPRGWLREHGHALLAYRPLGSDPWSAGRASTATAR